MKTNKVIKSSPKSVERLAGGVGAVASKSSNLMELHRSVLSCLLFEDIAYDNGKNIAKRIARLVPLVKAEDVASLAIEARTKANLRHVPLLLVREMARHESHKHLVADLIPKVVNRADELGELLGIYWKDGKTPIANCIKKGLASAFTKFDEYSLAKNNQDNKIKLRDVLFLTHAKPINKAQGILWKKLVDGKLETPDTWEVELSKSSNKKDSWERLLKENKLGAMALLRNLRNFEQSGVDEDLVKNALKTCNAEKILPFRFINAVKYAPRYQTQLENLMFRALEGKKKLNGKTIVVVDVSGSMGSRLSSKSEMSRMEAAGALAILLREQCEDPVFYVTAGSDGNMLHRTELISADRGFALSKKITDTAGHMGSGGIFLKQCLEFIEKKEKNVERVIVFSDSQDTDRNNKPDSAPAFGKKNYIIDISCEKGGIAFTKFNHINGFSERIFDYIAAIEESQ